MRVCRHIAERWNSADAAHAAAGGVVVGACWILTSYAPPILLQRC